MGVYLIFPKSWSDIIVFFVMYVCVSPSEVSYESCLSWRTMSYNPLSQSRPAAQGCLCYIFGNESADLHYHQLWWTQSKLILAIHSLLSSYSSRKQKTRRGWSAYSRRGAFLNFGRRGHLFEGSGDLKWSFSQFNFLVLQYNVI